MKKRNLRLNGLHQELLITHSKNAECEASPNESTEIKKNIDTFDESKILQNKFQAMPTNAKFYKQPLNHDVEKIVLREKFHEDTEILDMKRDVKKNLSKAIEKVQDITINPGSADKKFNVRRWLPAWNPTLERIFVAAVIGTMIFFQAFPSLKFLRTRDELLFLELNLGLGISSFLIAKFIFSPKGDEKKNKIRIALSYSLCSIIAGLGILQTLTLTDELFKLYLMQQIFQFDLIFLVVFYITVPWYLFILLGYISNSAAILFPKSIKKTPKTSIVPELPDTKSKLCGIIGEVHESMTGERIKNPVILTLSEKSLFTNLFVFGSIGSGKTVFLLSILKHLLNYEKDNPAKKACGLFIDEKGNLGAQIKELAVDLGREDDIYMFSLAGDVIFNPIYEPHKEAAVLARRLKTIMESTVEKGAAWIREYAYDFLHNAIKLCRLTSPHYDVTLLDLYSMIYSESLVREKLEFLKENKTKIIEDLSLISCDIEDVLTPDYLEKNEALISTYFLQSWFILKSKDPEVFGYISTSLSHLIEPFIDPKISHIFNPETPDKINFKGFDWMIKEGKLFVYSVPDSIYEGLGKYIALFLKLPFQKTCLSRVPKTNPGTPMFDPDYNACRPILFVADENQNSYHESDNEAIDKLRESKVIHICLTQNFVSLLAKSQSEQKIRQYLGSFRNKLFLACDDEKSAKFYSDLCCQKLMEKKSLNFSESSKKSNINLTSKQVESKDTNLNTSVSIHTHLEHNFDYSKFLELKLFQGIFSGFDGVSKIGPHYVYVKPNFVPWNQDYFSTILNVES